MNNIDRNAITLAKLDRIMAMEEEQDKKLAIQAKAIKVFKIVDYIVVNIIKVQLMLVAALLITRYL